VKFALNVARTIVNNDHSWAFAALHAGSKAKTFVSDSIVRRGLFRYRGEMIRTTVSILKTSLALFAALTIVTTGFANPAGAIRAQADASLQFTSPSRNIDCYMRADSANEMYVDCTAQNAKWPNEKPQPSDCDLDWDPNEIILNVKGRGNAVKPSLYVGGCRGDIGPICAPDECQVLNFGEKVSLRAITCESLKDGIKCVSNRGKKLGFRIGRNSWTRIS
jgi:hypothetical protein